MARLSEYIVIQHVSDGLGAVLVDDRTGEEVRITLARAEIGTVLTELSKRDADGALEFRGFRLEPEEATALTFFLGYFYAHDMETS